MKELIININGTDKHITAMKMENDCIDAMLKDKGTQYEAHDLEGNRYTVYGWAGYAKRRGYKYERV